MQRNDRISRKSRMICDGIIKNELKIRRCNFNWINQSNIILITNSKKKKNLRQSTSTPWIQYSSIETNQSCQHFNLSIINSIDFRWRIILFSMNCVFFTPNDYFFLGKKCLYGLNTLLQYMRWDYYFSR